MPHSPNALASRALLAAALAGCSGSDNTPPPADATVSDISADLPDAARDDIQDATPTSDFQLPPYDDPYACEPAAQAPPLDEGLDAAQARAGVITREAELIGGEGASGRVGHLKLYNDRVRFVIQGRTGDAGNARATGYDLYGGNIIDADRVRPTGEPGQDLFRETFPVVAFRVSNATEVRVVCDGSNGRPAAVRVIGRDASTRILGILDNVARERDVRIITHYILRPGTEVLEVRTEVQSNFGGAVPSSVAGDFLGFGNALTLFTDDTGFGNASRASAPQAWLAGVSDPGEGDRHVSYAIAPASGTMTVPIVDSSGTVGLYAPAVAPMGEATSFSRYFSVGTGDVTSAVEPLYRLRRDPFGVVTGTTTPGALVYAYRGGYAAGDTVRSVARAANDGRYRLALSPGMYSLVAVDEGRVRGAPVTVAVTNGGEATANPTAGATGTLALDLAIAGEGTERLRTPIKVSLGGVGAEAPDSAMGELEGERERFGLQRVIYSVTGQERVRVKPGRYRAAVSRGAEFEVETVDLEVPADGEATLTATLARSVDTTGYVAADFHQHTVGSIDSPRSLCGRVVEDIAEGLEWASTTDHDNVTDFMPCVRELSLGRWFNATQGNEISVVGAGHFNAYPMPTGGADPFRAVGAQYWADLSTQALFDRIRAEPTDPILHISHPRSTGLKGYFTSIALDPFSLTGRSQPLATGFEAIEVNTEVGDPADYLASNDPAARMAAMRDPSSVPTLRDWFSMLNRGDHTCALGNSDTHGRNDGSGWPHNLVRVGSDRPDQVDIAAIRTAIRAQKVVVASGLTLRVRVNGQERMGHTEVVTPTAGAVELDVEVQAPSWVDARTLVLFENGRPLALTDAGGGVFDARVATERSDPFTVALGMDSPGRTGSVRFRARVRARPTRDSHYVALARGGPLSPVGSGDAISYTNPVYVDVDGGGWRPTP